LAAAHQPDTVAILKDTGHSLATHLDRDALALGYLQHKAQNDKAALLINPHTLSNTLHLCHTSLPSLWSSQSTVNGSLRLILSSP
jgi:hypothetical protein